jgi:hypothetical protein
MNRRNRASRCMPRLASTDRRSLKSLIVRARLPRQTLQQVRQRERGLLQLARCHFYRCRITHQQGLRNTVPQVSATTSARQGVSLDVAAVGKVMEGTAASRSARAAIQHFARGEQLVGYRFGIHGENVFCSIA